MVKYTPLSPFWPPDMLDMDEWWCLKVHELKYKNT